MSLLRRILGGERRAIEYDPNIWGSRPNTHSGVEVTVTTAMQTSAVFGCVRILSESLAQLPLILYERKGNAKERAVNHPLYWLLHDQPNPELTSFEVREIATAHVALWGNSYSYIERDGNGRVLSIWPLRPDKMRIKRRPSGDLVYLYTMPQTGQVKPWDKYNILHIRGLGFDGFMGFSVLEMARNAIGTALAAEEYGARFYANGARPGGYLTFPGVLDDDQYKRLSQSWAATSGGLSNAHKVAILEEGLTYHDIGIPQKDAQFLETRKFQIAEIARFYRVPPHMLADLERATFSNIEQQSIEFVTHTLGPWLTRWEQALKRDLLSTPEKTRYYLEFLTAALLRGDITSRYEAYAKGRQNGWLSANDIRAAENMNPVEGGDVYLVPLNMIPAEQAAAPIVSAERAALLAGETRATATAPQGEERAAARHRLASAYMPAFIDAWGRVVRREANDIGNKLHLLRTDKAAFRDWLEGFYNEHIDFVKRQVGAVGQTYATLVAAEAAAEVSVETPDLERFVLAYLGTAAVRNIARATERLDTLAQKPNAEEEIQAELEQWRETRAATISAEEVTRLNNAVTKAVFVAAGVRYIRWRSFGDSCPYCTKLNGQVVDIERPFIPAGVSFKPEGAAVALLSRYDVGHPPAHRGCDCQITAA